jgi:hypothetical protein
VRVAPAASGLTGFSLFWLLAFAALWLVYGRAADYPFLLDDVFHFLENDTVHSWAGLPTVWTSNYWE